MVELVGLLQLWPAWFPPMFLEFLSAVDADFSSSVVVVVVIVNLSFFFILLFLFQINRVGFFRFLRWFVGLYNLLTCMHVYIQFIYIIHKNQMAQANFFEHKVCPMVNISLFQILDA